MAAMSVRQRSEAALALLLPGTARATGAASGTGGGSHGKREHGGSDRDRFDGAVSNAKGQRTSSGWYRAKISATRNPLAKSRRTFLTCTERPKDCSHFQVSRGKAAIASTTRGYACLPASALFDSAAGGHAKNKSVSCLETPFCRLP